MRRPPATDPDLARAARRGLAGLLAGTALFRMSQNMGVTTLSLLAREGVHLGATAVGLLGALAGLSLAAVTLFVSRRVPHTRAAASAVAGTVVLAASLLVLAVAPSFAVLLGGVLLLGAGGGVAMPGFLNAVVAETPARRERVIGLYTVTLSVSLAVGPLLETAMLRAAHEDVRVPFLLFALLPLAGAALVAGRHGAAGRAVPRRAVARRAAPRRAGAPGTGPVAGPPTASPAAAAIPVATALPDVELVTSPPPVVEVAPAVAPPAAAAGTLSGPPPPLPSSSASSPAGRARRRERVPGLLDTSAGRDALLAQLLYAVPFAGVTVFGALVARVGYGLSASGAQLGFTVFFAASLAARAAVAWRAPIAHKRVLLWLAATATAAGLVLLGTGHGTAAFLVAMGVLGIPHGLTFPLALALIADVTPVERLPRANATLIGSTNLTSVLAPLLLGAIVPAVGYRSMTLVILGPVVGFGLLRLGLGSRAWRRGGAP